VRREGHRSSHARRRRLRQISATSHKPSASLLFEAFLTKRASRPAATTRVPSAGGLNEAVEQRAEAATAIRRLWHARPAARLFLPPARACLRTGCLAASALRARPRRPNSATRCAPAPLVFRTRSLGRRHADRDGRAPRGDRGDHPRPPDARRGRAAGRVASAWATRCTCERGVRSVPTYWRASWKRDPCCALVAAWPGAHLRGLEAIKPTSVPTSSPRRSTAGRARCPARSRV
jgi:hypothetical protein